MNLTLALSIASVMLALVAILQGFILAGQSRMRADMQDMWKRVNHHSHVVTCPNIDCKALETGKVIIEEP